MQFRIANERDKERLKQLYRKIPLPFPELREMLPIQSIVDENDRIVVAVGCIPTVEVILFIDSEWETPGMRMEAFKQLHKRVQEDLLLRGIVQAHAVVPPFIEKFFGKRLTKFFGWAKSGWSLYSRRADNG